MAELSNVSIKLNSSWAKVNPFPVGAIYMSTTSDSPSMIYGGSWTALMDSRFLRPSGSWGSTGGESEYTLTVAEMPSHTHHLKGSDGGETEGGEYVSRYYKNLVTGGWNVSATGESKPHNNLPPYRNCYAWYRIA